MEPIEFPQQTMVLAKDQPEYRPLPAHYDAPRGTIICCWGLTWRERLKLLWTGRLWHRIMTFGTPLQPQLLETDSPWDN